MRPEVAGDQRKCDTPGSHFSLVSSHLGELDPAVTHRKCCILWPNLPSSVPGLLAELQIARDGIVQLGSPIGSEAFVQDMLARPVSDTGQFFGQLSELQVPQAAGHIARFCASSCKVLHLLRTTPPHLNPTPCRKLRHRVPPRGAKSVTFVHRRRVAYSNPPLRQRGSGTHPRSGSSHCSYLGSVFAAAPRLVEVMTPSS